MPQTTIRLFREANGTIRLTEWLAQLEKKEPEAYAKCLHVILELERLGFELAMPHAEFLRDGIYELRTRLKKVRYRILYFFYGQNVAVLTHGFPKDQRRTPPDQINLALQRRQLLANSPQRHLANWEL